MGSVICIGVVPSLCTCPQWWGGGSTGEMRMHGRPGVIRGRKCQITTPQGGGGYARQVDHNAACTLWRPPIGCAFLNVTVGAKIDE